MGWDDRGEECAGSIVPRLTPYGDGLRDAETVFRLVLAGPGPLHSRISLGIQAAFIRTLTGSFVALGLAAGEAVSEEPGDDGMKGLVPRE